MKKFALRLICLMLPVMTVLPLAVSCDKTDEAPYEGPLMCTRISENPGEDPFVVTAGAAPDPFITYDSETGYYYGMSTQNSLIEIRRKKTLANLFTEGEAQVVYRTGVEAKECIWAPEMYFFDGKWYIYTSAMMFDGTDQKRLIVLESETTDPFEGFHYKSCLDETLFGIDPTVYTDKESGRRFICFSQPVDGEQWLSIGELENPWTLKGETVPISSPDYKWEEEEGQPINEGAFFISSGKKLFIIYSANGCYDDVYCLGQLEFKGKKADDLMKKECWKKKKEPVFKQNGEIYATGHASFFYSPDGTELWMAYHCYDSSNEGNNRRRRMRVCQVQKITFTSKGQPVFGKPYQKDAMIPVPSGEADE